MSEEGARRTEGRKVLLEALERAVAMRNGSSAHDRERRLRAPQPLLEEPLLCTSQWQ